MNHPSQTASSPRTRVLHVTPSPSRMGGGVWQYVKDIIEHGAAAGLLSDLAGIDDPYVAQDTAPVPLGRLLTARRRGPWAFGFAPGLARPMRDAAAEVDAIHAHGGLRMWPNTQARHAARVNRKPLLLSPHGMLYPWLLKRSAWRKKLVAPLYDRKNQTRATALHATCMQELGYLREAKLTQAVAVIPPGINQPPPGDGRRWLANHPHLNGKRLAVFLGIMDRKKGLLRLAEAWGRLFRQHKSWHIVLAGADDYNHAHEVQAALDAHGCAKATTLLGGQWGQDKWDLLAAAELFLLPSDWENFGIVVGEALASGLPVITGKHTPWDWLPAERAGWFTDITVDALAEAMDDAMSIPASGLAARGWRGRMYVQHFYRWDQSIAQMIDVYRWLADKGERPGCVVG